MKTKRLYTAPMPPIRTAQLRLSRTIQLLKVEGLPRAGTIYHEQGSIFGHFDIMPALEPIEPVCQEEWTKLRVFCYLAGISIKYSPLHGFSVIHDRTKINSIVSPQYDTQWKAVVRLARAARAVSRKVQKAAAKSLQSST